MCATHMWRKGEQKQCLSLKHPYLLHGDPQKQQIQHETANLFLSAFFSYLKGKGSAHK